MPARGSLYLLPVPISPESGLQAIPQFNLDVVLRLRHFVAEDGRTARRNLKVFGYPDISSAQISILNEHTPQSGLDALAAPMLDGEDTGLMSDAGCPGIADPGAALVDFCHRRHIPVVPLAGPSSVVLAVMASGFNGQNFAFAGYLPVEKNLRIKRLRELEQHAGRTGQAQFFIETPYRNTQLVESMLAALQGDTRLFIGKNIGGNDALLASRTVSEWKRGALPELHKVPVVFGIFR